jgi:hypothetical protein
MEQFCASFNSEFRYYSSSVQRPLLQLIFRTGIGEQQAALAQDWWAGCRHGRRRALTAKAVAKDGGICRLDRDPTIKPINGQCVVPQECVTPDFNGLAVKFAKRACICFENAPTGAEVGKRVVGRCSDSKSPVLGSYLVLPMRKIAREVCGKIAANALGTVTCRATGVRCAKDLPWRRWIGCTHRHGIGREKVTDPVTYFQDFRSLSSIM